LSSQFKYTNPKGYKYIEGSVTTDDRKLYKFKINLPWAYVGWYIDDKEGNKVCSLINDQRTKHSNIVSEAKQIATTASNAYIVKKPVLTATQSKGNELATAKTNLEAQVKTLETSISAFKVSIEKEEKGYNELKAKATEAQAKANTLNSQLSAINAQISEINQALDLLKSSTTVTAEQATALKSLVDKADSACKSQLATLQSFAPNRATEIKAIQDAVTKLDQVNVSSNLNKITPTS